MYTFNYATYSKALGAVSPYLEILEGLAEGNSFSYAVLGIVSIDLRRDMTAAEEWFREALAVDNDNVLANRYLCKLLICSGRHPEALRSLNHLIQIDPVSVNGLISTGRYFYLLRLYDTALKYLSEALELESASYIALAMYGAVLIEQQNYGDARKMLEKSLSEEENADTLSRLGMIAALTNDISSAQEYIRRIKDSAGPGNSLSIKLARIYLVMGELDRALLYLRTSEGEHELELTYLRVDPSWSKLKGHPEFEDLCQRLGV